MAGWDDGRRGWVESVDMGDSSPDGGAMGGGIGLGVGQERKRKWESCKPWRGSRCVLYHEHEETERCGDVFMGRGRECV
jgi:hypothetical protein